MPAHLRLALVYWHDYLDALFLEAGESLQYAFPWRAEIGHRARYPCWSADGQFTCPSDVDGDGEVGINDFLEILADWDSDDCNADLDRDGVVGIADFLQLLAEWGACP